MELLRKKHFREWFLVSILLHLRTEKKIRFTKSFVLSEYKTMEEVQKPNNLGISVVITAVPRRSPPR
jgi:hypothetical protein